MHVLKKLRSRTLVLPLLLAAAISSSSLLLTTGIAAATPGIANDSYNSCKYGYVGTFTTNPLENYVFQPGEFCLFSPNNDYYAIFQDDGNFVTYHQWPYGQAATWASETNGFLQGTFWIQADGNFVIYPEQTPQYPVWSTNTGKNPSDRMVMENSGDLVIYNTANKIIWQTQ